MNKYDRQIRIWGDYGQQCLETSNVCIIGVTAANCEALKGLILPGLGSFTIVDSKKSLEAYSLSNFFYHHNENLTKSECVLESLQNLNTSSLGCTAEYEVVISDVNKYTLFIVADGELAEDKFEELAEQLWNAEVPMLLVFSRNNVGAIIPLFQEMCVIDAHVDFDLKGLCLYKPFETLNDMCKQTFTDNEDVKVIPWPLLVLHYSSANSDVCERLNSVCESLINTDANECRNFQEAIKYAKRSLENPLQHDKLACMFNYIENKLININKAANSQIAIRNRMFWIIFGGLKRFVADEAFRMPVNPQLPDMHSNTSLFTMLKTVYRDQAAKDLQRLIEICQSLLPDAEINLTLLKIISANCSSTTVVRGRSYRQIKEIALKNEDANPPLCAIISRHLFNARWNRNPVYTDNPSDHSFTLSEYKKLPAILKLDKIQRYQKIKGRDGDITKINNMHLNNVVDCILDGSDNNLAPVTNWIGNAVAHEAIKIITGQYIISPKILIFDGHLMKIETF
ncbi:hypothetical protein GJ496_011310 [Pomphorhynchus laevis]|nr:hypothetical protein GJ496_011310 [Pomphorhynchus laevis]